MEVKSPSFASNSPIPIRHTGDGQNISPALQISNIPTGTKTLSIIMDDPDAPSGTFDHWIAFNIEPTKWIDEGQKIGVEGTNGFGTIGYKGPKPPPGAVHHYSIKVYALDISLMLEPGATKSEVEDGMKGHILAQAELVGTYKR